MRRAARGRRFSVSRFQCRLRAQAGRDALPDPFLVKAGRVLSLFVLHYEAGDHFHVSLQAGLGRPKLSLHARLRRPKLSLQAGLRLRKLSLQAGLRLRKLSRQPGLRRPKLSLQTGLRRPKLSRDARLRFSQLNYLLFDGFQVFSMAHHLIIPPASEEDPVRNASNN